MSVPRRRFRAVRHGTRSATRPTRARAWPARARSACAGPRSRASSARELAIARALAVERRRRLRGLRARARSREGQTFINPVRLSNAQDFGEVLRRRRSDEGRHRGGAPFGALDPRAFLPRLASRHRDVTLPREHLGAASSDERDSSNIPTGCAFVPNKVESEHTYCGQSELYNSGIAVPAAFSPSIRKPARVAALGKRFFFRLEKNDARPGTRFFFRQSAHRASA